MSDMRDKWLPGERRVFILLFMVLALGGLLLLSGCGIDGAGNSGDWMPAQRGQGGYLFFGWASS